MKMVSLEAASVACSSTLIQLAIFAPAGRSMFGWARLNSRSPMWTTLAFSKVITASPLVCPAP